jgi:hypothetical protein
MRELLEIRRLRNVGCNGAIILRKKLLGKERKN